MVRFKNGYMEDIMNPKNGKEFYVENDRVDFVDDSETSQLLVVLLHARASGGKMLSIGAKPNRQIQH